MKNLNKAIDKLNKAQNDYARVIHELKYEISQLEDTVDNLVFCIFFSTPLSLGLLGLVLNHYS